jgi:hypothetical protein
MFFFYRYRHTFWNSIFFTGTDTLFGTVSTFWNSIQYRCKPIKLGFEVFGEDS